MSEPRFNEWTDEMVAEQINNIKVDNVWLEARLKSNNNALEGFQAELDRRALAAFFAKHGGIELAEGDSLLVNSANEYYPVGKQLCVNPWWAWRNTDTDAPLVSISSGIIKEIPLTLAQEWRRAYLASTEIGLAP